MIQPELLQLIRQEVLTFAGMARLSANLHFIEPDVLRRHVEHLFLTGELSGSARFEHRRLVIEIAGLTPAGARMLVAMEQRTAGRP